MKCIQCVFRHVWPGCTLVPVPTRTAKFGLNHAHDEALGAVAPPSARLGLAALALSMLLSSLGTSVANVALPTLARAFGATFQTTSWVVLAYLLTVTCAIVSVGRLGDRVGRRRLLLAGLLLFSAAAIVAGLAPTLSLVIVARAAQGLGAAVMMALSLAFVAEVVPPARTGGAMGLLGTASAIGTALGPSLGGIVIDQLGWRAMFLVHVPLALFAAWLAHRSLPADRPTPATDRVGFDGVGTLLLAATLAAYSLAMTLGRGHPGLLNVALLLGSALGGGLFVFAERRADAPLIRLALLREPGLSTGLVANLLVSTVLMATLIVGPFYLSRSLGLDAGLVGAVLSLGPIVAALLGVPAGRIVDRIGTGHMTTAGLVAIAAGAGLLSLTSEDLGIAGYVAPTVVLTAGYALFQVANNTAVMTGVGPEQRGLVSGTLNLSRNLGLITGTSVMGAVFACAAGTDDITAADPKAVAAGMRVTFAVAAALILAALGIVAAGRNLAAHRP